MNLQIDTVKKEIHLLDMVPPDTLIAELEKLIPSYKEYKLTTYYPFSTPAPTYPYYDIPTVPSPAHPGAYPMYLYPQPDPFYYWQVTCNPKSTGTLQ